MKNNLIGEFAGYFRPGFMDWLAENWEIYRAFEWHAYRVIATGRERFSARTILHELRHYSALAEKGATGLKINNDHSPDLGRVFVILHPEHAHFWEFRRPDWPAFLRAVKERHARAV